LTIRYGIIAKHHTVKEAIQEATLAERCGFDSLGFVDSQSVYSELYVTMAACAGATSRLRLLPAVSNPVTRHPAVSASAMASVADLSGGRAEFGIGSGDSALLNLGERPAKLAETRAYALAVRDLLTTGKANYHGRTLSMSWKPQGPIPIWIAAEGPKTLELAGEVADGVIVNPGLLPELVGDSLQSIAIGAERAGRAMSSIKVQIIVRVNVCDDAAAGIKSMMMELASSAHHVFRFTTEGKRVPKELLDAVKRVQKGYVPAEHEHIGGANAGIVEREPELLQYLADRFAAVGPPEAVAEKLTTVAEAGISSFLFTGFVADRPALMHALSEQVLPRVRTAMAGSKSGRISPNTQ
jgi:5,10-methylenetetrahydromethanopterin reductase